MPAAVEVQSPNHWTAREVPGWILFFFFWIGSAGLGGGFPHSSVGKESACNTGDLGSIPALGRSPWRRKWKLTPVFLPGESHGQRSLAGYGPCCKSRTRLSD